MSTLKVTNIESPSGGGVSAKINDIGGGQLSNRQLIINGGMQVAQRGTSATVSNGSNEGYSTVDRWFLNFNDSIGGATTFSQSTDAPAGFSNSAKIQCSTTASGFASNQYLALQHKFEAQNLQSLAYGTADAKSITVSWYMKTDVYTDPISFALFTDDGTAEYYTVSVTPTTSWARYSVTVPGSSTATINNDNGAGLFLQFVFAGNTSSAIAAASDSTAYSTTRADFRTDVGNFLSSTSNAIYITGVQLEVGNLATSFEHRSYGDELQRCQRYYYEVCSPNYESEGIGSGEMWETNAAYISVSFPTTMRALPSFSGFGAGTGPGYIIVYANNTFGYSNDSNSILALQRAGVNGAMIYTNNFVDTASGVGGSIKTFPQGYAVWMEKRSSSLRINFNAEL